MYKRTKKCKYIYRITNKYTSLYNNIKNNLSITLQVNDFYDNYPIKTYSDKNIYEVLNKTDLIDLQANNIH